MANRLHELIDTDHLDSMLRAYVVFLQTADIVLKYANAHFYRKTGLSMIKFTVLNILVLNDASMKPSEIAEWTYKERHNITTMVKRMEKDGLVKTIPDDTDKRSFNVIMTDKGREARHKAMPVAKEIVDRVMSLISEDDAVQMEKRLRVLRQNAHRGLQDIAGHSPPQTW